MYDHNFFDITDGAAKTIYGLANEPRHGFISTLISAIHVLPYV